MPRVLIIYASRHGSTQEIAEAIGDELRAAGLEADCVRASDVRTLECDAVVLGSAVYAGRWRHEARHILRAHGDELARMPFWVFSTGPVGDPAHEDESVERWLEPRRVIERAQKLGVRDHVVFGGSLGEHPEGFLQRRMANDTPAEFRDRRDWDEIRGWAQGIAAELRAPVA